VQEERPALPPAFLILCFDDEVKGSRLYTSHQVISFYFRA
jgi:hypothetical protein